MKTLAAIAGSVLLLIVAALCLFGFLATFEPTNHPGQFLAFRIGYAVVGVGSVAGIVALIVMAARR